MYTKEIRLKHNEIAAKVNTETGEIKEITKRPNNIPEDKEIFERDAKFAKCYKRTWNFLKFILSDTEYRIVHEMSLQAKPRTNSLAPLNNETSLDRLCSKYRISKSTASRIFSKLKGLGVYAEIDVEYDFEAAGFWVLNPYIAYNSRVIDKLLVEIFSKTTIGKEFIKG